MKRVYLVVPLLLAAAFSSIYVPWRVEEQKVFDLEGPGRIANAVNVSSVSLEDDRGIYLVEDTKTIASIVALLSPDFADWQKASPAHRSIGWLRFAFKASFEHVNIRLGENFAQCGPYARMLPTSTTRELHRLLKTGRYVSHH